MRPADRQVEPVDFDSTDVDATEEFFVRAYTKMQLGSSAERFRARMSRRMIGGISLDRLDIGFDLAYDADPLGKVCLCTVESGLIADQTTDGWTDDFGPGDVVSFAPPDQPYRGNVRNSRYTITMFDPELLTKVARSADGMGGPVKLRQHRPVSREAGAQLRDTIDYLSRLADDTPTVAAEPLIVATASELLAASALNAFGAEVEDTPADSRDSHPATLRRAIAFIESQPEAAIGPAEIAAAAQVTVRAIQLAFRRHLDTTPMAYLREVRLTEAHRQLAAADPATASVTAVAARWGFHHPGRFAARYRAAFGVSPGETLTS